ncbi:hypothetical protein [Burkholderia thailandensis]|uniref:hypothetical protein n=1 Tax=Burkholderia thailandensis TaxID=57975 RepID=UPI000A742205|nr:hypothetical protein [Burkholderia thailandensis]
MRSITFWELVEMKVQVKKEAIDDRQQTGQRACPCQCLVASHRTYVDTEVAARLLLVDPHTLYKSHSRNGSYGSIRPVRLPSRKLAWPLAEIEKLFSRDVESD